MKIGDLCFVKDSLFIPSHKPVIIVETYKTKFSSYEGIVVLYPETGERYEYQEHNLSEVPL